jgi:ankyrin repeat protein
MIEAPDTKTLAHTYWMHEALVSVSPNACAQLNRLLEENYDLPRDAVAICAWKGQISTLQLVLSLGSDPNALRNGQSALWGLIGEDRPDRLEVWETLLRAGADPHAVGSTGFTPLEHAKECEQLDLVAATLAHQAQVSQANLQSATPKSLPISTRLGRL